MRLLIDAQTLIWFFYSDKPFVREYLAELATSNSFFLIDYVVEDFLNVLFKKKYFTNNEEQWQEAIDNVKFVIDNSTFFTLLVTNVKPQKVSNCRDMKDNFIIDFGIENKFDGIISADKDLLEYKTDKIKIMNINNWYKELC